MRVLLSLHTYLCFGHSSSINCCCCRWSNNKRKIIKNVFFFFFFCKLHNETSISISMLDVPCLPFMQRNFLYFGILFIFSFFFFFFHVVFNSYWQNRIGTLLSLLSCRLCSQLFSCVFSFQYFFTIEGMIKGIFH